MLSQKFDEAKIRIAKELAKTVDVSRGIPFRTEKIEFEDREEAKEWIINNQLGRRNLLVRRNLL